MVQEERRNVEACMGMWKVRCGKELERNDRRSSRRGERRRKVKAKEVRKNTEKRSRKEGRSREGVEDIRE